MDACNWDLICSQPAFWIGILYDDEVWIKPKKLLKVGQMRMGIFKQNSTSEGYNQHLKKKN